MALIFEGSVCAICGERLNRAEPMFATSGCAFPPGHELWRYCDAPMHWGCYEQWPHRQRFARAYFDLLSEFHGRNPFWGRVYLDEAVGVSVQAHEVDPVDPQPAPDARVSVWLAEVGTGTSVALAGWDAWVDDANTATQKLHPLVARALVSVLPRLRERLPDAATLWRSLDAVAVRQRAQAFYDQRNADRSASDAKRAEHNRRCRLTALKLTRRGGTCPHCRTTARDFELRDDAEDRHAWIFCPHCKRSFDADDLRDS